MSTIRLVIKGHVLQACRAMIDRGIAPPIRADQLRHRARRDGNEIRVETIADVGARFYGRVVEWFCEVNALSASLPIGTLLYYVESEGTHACARN